MQTKILMTAAAWIAAAIAPATAGTFTLVETGTVSGNMNGVPFTNAGITVTMFGDTANFGFVGGSNPAVKNGGGYIDVAGFSRVNLPAWDSFNVINIGGTVYLVDNGFQGLGFSSPAVAGWDTKTPIGPVTGTGSSLGGYPISTGGSLSITGTSGTFTLTSSAPEPASMALVGMALIIGSIAVRRRPRRR